MNTLFKCTQLPPELWMWSLVFGIGELLWHQVVITLPDRIVCQAYVNIVSPYAIAAKVCVLVCVLVVYVYVVYGYVVCVYVFVLICVSARYGEIKVGWKKIQRNIGHFLVLVEYISIALSYKRKKFTVQFFNN